MDERLRPVLVRRIPSEVACGDSLARETSRLNGNSRIRAILCFSSLKDSGGGEIFGEGLELDTTRKQSGKTEYPNALYPRGERNAVLGREADRTSTYFSMMITGNPAFDSWRACSSAALRLEKVPN